jgi:hypothetical protein
MRIQLTKPIGALLTAGLLALPTCLQAQPTAHYAPGTEGLKAATLPPPGLWVRDYNEFYYADHANDANGNNAHGQTALVYVNAPRLLWITDVTVLGGNVGVDALVPLNYSNLKGVEEAFTPGDLFFEGTWSMHLKQWDFALGAGAWAPTGNFSTSNPAYAGQGYWGEMFTAGATWYPDEEKRWSVSVLNRYELNQVQERTGMLPGQAYTVEGGIGYAVTKIMDVGPIAYYQQRVTGDSGSTTSANLPNRVLGVGPEVSVFFPSAMLGVSLRWAYEVLAENRLQGQTATLTITKKF